MTNTPENSLIADEDIGVANLFRTWRDRSTFLLSFEERLERIQKVTAAFKRYAALDDQSQLELRARWAEALLALAIHPSATAIEFERKLSMFAQIDPLILPCHHPKLFVLALSVAMSHDGAAVGAAIEIAVDGETVGGPPSSRH